MGLDYIPDGLVAGKKYQIDWSAEFSISSMDYYLRQGFSSTTFCEKMKECIDKNAQYSKFEYLGMNYSESGHFHCSFAKVKIFDEIILIPHQCLKRNNK